MLELEVPFLEKDQAKNLGAKWDPIKKKWFIPAGIDINLFMRWWPKDLLPTTSLVPAEQTNTPAQSYTLEPLPLQEKSQETLSIFLKRISVAVAQAIPGMTWIVAEISELRKHSSGYYLTLVEYQEEHKTAQVAARIWQGQEQNTIMKFKQTTEVDLTPGIQVLILVAVTFHPQYGLTLALYDIEPAYTLGNMAAKLAKIRQILRDEKIADLNKLLPSPKDFFNIAVISPEQAAGLGDFQREADLLAQHQLCNFTYYTAIFQGKTAANSISQALQAALLAHAATPYDAVVIIRGGGAVADLAWLNDLELARLICLSPVKIMAGIGHERDFTIIDEVAGLKFDTPSKVINYIFQVITSNATQASSAFTDIVNYSQALIQQINSKISLLQEAIAAAVFKSLALEQNNIHTLLVDIKRLASQTLTLAIAYTEQILREILALGPEAIQKRGFVVVSTTDHITVPSLAQAQQHEQLRLQFYDGSMMVTKLQE